MAGKKIAGRSSRAQSVGGRKTSKVSSRATKQPSAKLSGGKMPKTKVTESRVKGGEKQYKAVGSTVANHKTGHSRNEKVAKEKFEHSLVEKAPVERVRIENFPVVGRLVKFGFTDRGPARDLEQVVTGASEVTVSAGSGKTATVSGALLALLRDVAEALEHGESVIVVGEETEAQLTAEVISSQEAADLLNVSRPHVVKLAKAGELPHHMVGNRHRFELADVLAYAERMRTTRDEALSAIVPAGGYTAEDF